MFSSNEQLVMRVDQKSDVYALGKMIVLVLFKWNFAWWLLGTPKDENVAKFFDMNPMTRDVVNFISKMVQVDFELRPNIHEVMEKIPQWRTSVHEVEDQ